MMSHQFLKNWTENVSFKAIVIILMNTNSILFRKFNGLMRDVCGTHRAVHGTKMHAFKKDVIEIRKQMTTKLPITAVQKLVAWRLLGLRLISLPMVGKRLLTANRYSQYSHPDHQSQPSVAAEDKGKDNKIKMTTIVYWFRFINLM